MKKLLIEDIQRISSIMEYNNMKVNPTNIIIESLLLTESPPEVELISKLKNILSKPSVDRAVKDAVERVVGRDVNKTVEVLLDEYLVRAIQMGQPGKVLLKSLIKDVAEVNKEFAYIIADKFKPQYDRLVNQYRIRGSANAIADAQRIFEINYGKKVANIISRMDSQVIKPTALTDVDDFQEWLNNEVPDWYNGNKLSKTDGNFGTYNKITENEWKKYGKIYLERIQPPNVLDTKERIKNFQNWLDKTHPDWIDAPLEKTEAKGYGTYGPKTREAFKKYETEYYQTLPIGERINAVKYNELSPKTLVWWERIISSDKTLSDKLRGLVDAFVQKAIISLKTEEIYIDDAFSKFKQALDESITKLKTGENLDLSLYRNVQQMCTQISGKNDIELQKLYKTIAEVLNKRYPNRSTEIEEMMKSIETQNPFKQKRWGWLTETINSSSSAKLLNNFIPERFKKETIFTKKLSEISERLFYLMGIGNPKTADELLEYVVKGKVLPSSLNPFKIFKGPNSLYKWMYLSTHVGAPGIIASFQTLGYMKGLIGSEGNSENDEGPLDTWWRNFFQNVKNAPWWSWIIPFHSYAYQIFETLREIKVDLYNEKYKDIFKDGQIRTIQLLYDNKRITPTLYVSLVAVTLLNKNPDDEFVKSIKEDESGFNSFCDFTKLNFKSWDTIKKEGMTTDNKVWKYDGDDHTFNDVTPDTTATTDTLTNRIANNKAGFIAFCLIPGNEVTFKSFNDITKTGETTDGRTWEFNETKTTFEDKDIKKFKDFIKTAWGTDYNDTHLFTKEGDIYVVDVKNKGKFKYKYNGTTFIRTKTN